MSMPEGWERLEEDDVNHPEASVLMKEMFESLELAENGLSWANLGQNIPIVEEVRLKVEATIKKFKEWK